MRTLVVAGEYPWPENSGSRMRLATTLRGLARCGPTDLFAIVPAGRTDFDRPDDRIGLERVGRMAFDAGPPRGVRRAWSWARPWVPLELPWQDGPGASRALLRFAEGSYDLVWYFGIRPWALVGGREAAPVVLDIDDLENHKIGARLANTSPVGGGRGPDLRRWAARVFSAEEARRWGRLYRRAGESTALVVVCSPLDADRARAAGVPRVAVVPNAYRSVDRSRGRPTVSSPPTILFHGTLRYPPNADAARFLVEEVRPALAALIPDVRLRMVGVATPAIAALDDAPGLTVVGPVADMADELERADVVLVPLRFGSGTRLKIIEAFAHRIPVVSTTLGAEGLDAEDGHHLLLADTPAALARACARLLSDDALRARLVANAHALFEARFTSAGVEEIIAGIAVEAGGGPGAVDRP